jgi:hypothetical protein
MDLPVQWEEVALRTPLDSSTVDRQFHVICSLAHLTLSVEYGFSDRKSFNLHLPLNTEHLDSAAEDGSGSITKRGELQATS